MQPNCKCSKVRILLFLSPPFFPIAFLLSFFFLVVCMRLYKSLCRSVGRLVRRLVGLSHFAFFAFLGYLKVGKHIFKYLRSYKQHLHLYKSPCWSVGPSVCLSRFAFFAYLGYLQVGKHIFEYLESYKQHSRLNKSLCWSVGPSVCLSRFDFFAFFWAILR